MIIIYKQKKVHIRSGAELYLEGCRRFVDVGSLQYTGLPSHSLTDIVPKPAAPTNEMSKPNSSWEDSE